MATKLTKKQQTQLTEKLTGIIQKNNALQLRLSADRSVNELNINQISGALNRIHGQAIGKDLPTEIIIPLTQSGSGDPSPDNIRPIVGYEIDGIGTVYEGVLNIETASLTTAWRGQDGGIIDWIKITSYNYGNFYSPAIDDLLYIATRPTVISSNYKSESNSSASPPADNYVWVRSTGGKRLYVKDSGKENMTAKEFKNAMEGVIFVYELGTPETYTLTPQQMLQLLDHL